MAVTSQPKEELKVTKTKIDNILSTQLVTDYINEERIERKKKERTQTRMRWGQIKQHQEMREKEQKEK